MNHTCQFKKKILRTVRMISAAPALTLGLAFAATDGLADTGCDRTPSEILNVVNARLMREFIGHDGLVLDYVGDIPTPEEIADLKPNAMGWWCPIENGSMFTGKWLPALMAEGRAVKTNVEICVRGLVKMSEVSDVPGFIARGTGTDGRSHHPCGSNDQTDPWFIGLCEYCRWPYADPALKAKALERLVFVAKALEKNDWGVPCDGPFKGQDRGNLNAKAMPFWGKTRLLYSLKSLYALTGDGHWNDVYRTVKSSALDEIEQGGETDRKAFSPCYTGGIWIYISTAEALARLIEMEENPADKARFRRGFARYAERVAPMMKDRVKYANTVERPFRYANWRTGYAWRPQKTQREAEAVAGTGKRDILGTRKDYERNGMTIPLAAAAICALEGDVRYRAEILATLCHYDYSTPNVSEFFHAAIAAAALRGKEPGGLRVALCCDPQFGYDHELRGEEAYQACLGRLERVIAALNRLKPDLVCFAGDMVNSWRDVSRDWPRLLGELQMPWVVTVGNHDVPSNATEQQMAFAAVFGSCYSAKTVNGWRIISLNGQLERAKTPDASYVAWRDRELADLKQSGRPGIVLTHQPPFVQSVGEADSHENYPKATRRELLDRMVDAGVKYVLAGHTHRFQAKAYRGVPILNAETTSNNFDGRPYGFRLLTIRADECESWEFIKALGALD